MDYVICTGCGKQHEPAIIEGHRAVPELRYWCSQECIKRHPEKYVDLPWAGCNKDDASLDLVN